MDRSTAIGLGCGTLIFAIVGCVIIALVMRPGDDDVRLEGRVSISPAYTAACEDARVVITPEGRGARTLRFEASSWRYGQGCTLPVSEAMPKADRYRVEVPGVGVETIVRGSSETVRFDISW